MVAPSRPSGRRTVAARTLSSLVVLALALSAGPADAQESTVVGVVRSQHVRLSFARDIQRVAVGDEEIASVDIITSREVLVLGKVTGRTTLITWFTGGGLAERIIAVRRDLSVLQEALRLVHPSLLVESAPDRDALVLTGRVPDYSVSQRAEAVVRAYLDADGRGRAAVRPVLDVPPAGAAAPAPPASPLAAAAAGQRELPPSGTVINLIQIERALLLPEDRVREAIRPIGGDRVSVRRVQRGNLRDDDVDTLVLEGEVSNQIALVRVIELAAQVFAQRRVGPDDIDVLADEAGGLASGAEDAQAGQNGGNFGVRAGGVLGGGRGNARLNNQVRRNLARASAVSAAGGRILSFIRVTDLPQIRVNIRVYEVNRQFLRSHAANTAALAASRALPAEGTSLAAVAQGASTSGSRAAVQNVLAFLGGGLLNEVEFTGSHAAITQALAVLERDGLARTLSSPSLTVLSGEVAQFQVGGEVPVPVAFSPAIGGAAAATPGVFSAVDFVSFGLQLQVRPLVGDDDVITVDVQPQVVTPDAALTASIRETSGTNQETTSFATRALRTSARLADGASMLVGGLSSQSLTTSRSKAPGLGDVPGLGWLFRNDSRSDESRDLVIVVNPVIVRQPLPDAPLWMFPSTGELLHSVISPPPASPR